jgi:hypothetical protein
MLRSGTRVLTSLLFVAAANTASAQDMDAWLNAEGWDLAYEVTFKSSDSGAYQFFHGPITYTRTVEYGFNATLALDMRNAGPNVAMSAMTVGRDLSTPEAQQAMMELVMRTDVIANWMSGGPQVDESASDEAQMNAVREYMESSKGMGRLQYSMVEKGVGLVEESGSKYDLVRTTTARGTGPIVGPTQLLFEIDAESKKYLLTLAAQCSDKSDSTVIEETVGKYTWKNDPPTEERSMNYWRLDNYISGLKIDDSSAVIGDVPLMAGTLDPSSGKISGERTLRGHYSKSGVDIPGMFYFRWTLSPRK